MEVDAVDGTVGADVPSRMWAEALSLAKDHGWTPAGTRLVAKGAMDNSDRNPANPDPSKPVHFGLQSIHEMFFGFTTLRYEGDTPEALAGDEPSGAKVAGF